MRTENMRLKGHKTTGRNTIRDTLALCVLQRLLTVSVSLDLFIVLIAVVFVNLTPTTLTIICLLLSLGFVVVVIAYSLVTVIRAALDYLD